MFKQLIFSNLWYKKIIKMDAFLSKELQTGKAGEHFVCYDLITQGYNAFLSDQGLPYDVIADIGGKLMRVQVKSTSKKGHFPKSKNIYRFSLRSARKGSRKVSPNNVDIVAFVALDIKEVAYMPVSTITSKKGHLTSCIEFRDRNFLYGSRVYSNGTERSPNTWGKYIQDYSKIINEQ